MKEINDFLMKLFCLFVVLSFSVICIAQKPHNASININSEFYEGKDLMVMLGNPWIPTSHTDFKYVDTSNVYRDSKAGIKIRKAGTIVEMVLAYPHPFGIAYFDTATMSGSGSYVFFVGDGKIDLDIEDFTEAKGAVTSKMSSLNREYLNLRKSYGEFVDFETRELYNVQGKLDVIGKYSTKHPNSYVAMWDLAMSYSSNLTAENKITMLNALDKFSDKLKQTKTFISLVELLQQDLVFKVGVVVPNILINSADSLYAISAKSKYTLIDFWFSSCGPCVAQFPDLAKTYDAYKAKGFEIVGISTDTDESKWQAAINKYQMNWIQQLDENEAISNKYFIRKFPTNFLIDATGKILAVDIKPEELTVFLYANLGH